MMEFLSIIAGMPPAMAAVLTVVYVHLLIARVSRRQTSIAGQVQAIAKYMGIEIASGAHVVKETTSRGKSKYIGLFLLTCCCAFSLGCASSARTVGNIGGTPVDLQTNGSTTIDGAAIAAAGKAAGMGLADGLGLGPLIAAGSGLAAAAAGCAGYLSERGRRKFHEKDADEAYRRIMPEEKTAYQITDPPRAT